MVKAAWGICIVTVLAVGSKVEGIRSKTTNVAPVELVCSTIAKASMVLPESTELRKD